MIKIIESDTKNLKYGIHKTPFGTCAIAISDEVICKMSFETDENQFLTELHTEWTECKIEEDIIATEDMIQKIFIEKVTHFTLDVKGTDFQRKVWQEVIKIEEGQTKTYGEIAKNIEDPQAARAVGTAVGKNPVAYLIPCHRVIRSDGDLGGYRWGEALKEKLLAHETI